MPNQPTQTVYVIWTRFDAYYTRDLAQAEAFAAKQDGTLQSFSSLERALSVTSLKPLPTQDKK